MCQIKYRTHAIISRSWIPTINKVRNLWKKLLKNTFLVFKHGEKSIKTWGYNRTRTVRVCLDQICGQTSGIDFSLNKFGHANVFSRVFFVSYCKAVHAKNFSYIVRVMHLASMLSFSLFSTTTYVQKRVLCKLVGKQNVLSHCFWW